MFTVILLESTVQLVPVVYLPYWGMGTQHVLQEGLVWAGSEVWQSSHGAPESGLSRRALRITPPTLKFQGRP